MNNTNNIFFITPSLLLLNFQPYKTSNSSEKKKECEKRKSQEYIMRVVTIIISNNYRIIKCNKINEKISIMEISSSIEVDNEIETGDYKIPYRLFVGEKISRPVRLVTMRWRSFNRVIRYRFNCTDSPWVQSSKYWCCRDIADTRRVAALRGMQLRVYSDR